MEADPKLRTSYGVDRKIGSFYTGGKVAISKDERFLFCSHGAAVNIVSIDTGRTIGSLVADEEDNLNTFALSPDNKFLITCAQSLLVRQWNISALLPDPENADDADSLKVTDNSTLVEQFSQSWRIHGGAPVCVSAFDSSSTLVALGTTRGAVQVWDATKRFCTHNFKGPAGLIGSVAFHPTSLRLYSASPDGVLNVWSLEMSQRVMTLKGHVSAVSALRFADNGHILLSAGRDQIVHVWDVDTGCSRKTIPVFEHLDDLVVLEGDTVFPGSSSKERQRNEVCFATAGAKGVLRTWSVGGVCLHSPSTAHIDTKVDAGADTEESATLANHHIVQVALCPNRKQVCSVTFNHDISFHNLSRTDLTIVKHLSGFNEEIIAVRSVGPTTQVAMATNSDSLRIVDVTTQDVQVLYGHTDVLMAVDASADGSWLATCSKDMTVRVWTRVSSENTGKLEENDSSPATLATPTRFHCVGIGRGHTAAVGAVACSLPEATVPFLISAARDCTLKVWEVQHVVQATRSQATPSTGPTTTVSRLDVRFTQQAHSKDINAVCISPKNKLIASAGADKVAKLWSCSDGTLQGILRGHRRGVWSVAFSPVDRIVATASADATLRVWSLHDHSCIRTFEGHANSALSVLFMSRGMQLCSAGGDGLLKVWNIRSGDLVCTLDGHEDRVWSVCCRQDGDVLVSGGSDSALVVWQDTTEQVAQKAHDENEQLMLAQQELSNLLANNLYTKAVALALKLEQPFRLLGIVKTILELPDGESISQLDQALADLRDDQISVLLKFASTWNTNGRHSRAAQAVINSLLRRHHPQRLAGISEVSKALEPLLSYTERHATRLSNLSQQAAFVEFTWKSMKPADIAMSN